MRGALSSLPDWKADVFAGPSQQARLQKIPSLLSAAFPMDQPEERNYVVFEAPSDGPEGTEGEWLSTNYHRE
jgi:hypothetical protein